VAAYFSAANGASTALYTYTARGIGISSTGGVKLQRERRGRNCSSTGRSKLQCAAPAQTTNKYKYAFNKIKIPK
jgi:hypothetical protein